MLVLPVAAAAAIAAIVAGVVVMVASTPQSASFGWFAYAPLSSMVFSPAGTVVIGWGTISGAAVVVLGIACLAFWAGWMLARSRTASGR